MTHKSYEQLAQSAYEAYRKGINVGMEDVDKLCPWEELSESERQEWVPVAKQLWAEFAAIH